MRVDDVASNICWALHLGNVAPRGSGRLLLLGKAWPDPFQLYTIDYDESPDVHGFSSFTEPLGAQMVSSSHLQTKHYPPFQINGYIF
jgi:hypothetical protein